MRRNEVAYDGRYGAVAFRSQLTQQADQTGVLFGGKVHGTPAADRKVRFKKTGPVTLRGDAPGQVMRPHRRPIPLPMQSASQEYEQEKHRGRSTQHREPRGALRMRSKPIYNRFIIAQFKCTESKIQMYKN